MIIGALVSYLKILNQHKFLTILAILCGIFVGVVVAVTGSPVLSTIIVLAAFGGMLFFSQYKFGVIITVMILYMRASDNLSSYAGAPEFAAPLLILMLAAVGVRMLTTPMERNNGIKACVLILVYMFSYYGSVLLAQNRTTAMRDIDDLPKNMIIVFLIATVCSNFVVIRELLGGLSLTGLIMGSVVVFQYVTKTYDNAYLGFGRANIQNITRGSSDYRAAGVIGDPNYFGQILVALIPLTIISFLHAEKPWQKLLYALCFLMTMLGIFTTFSRGAFMGLAISIGLLVLYKKPKPVYIIIFLVIALIGFSFLPASFQERIFSISELTDTSQMVTEVSYRGRMSEAIVAIQMTLNYPLVGVGPKNFAENYSKYANYVGLDNRENRNAHNMILQISAEQGMFGVFALLFGLFIIYIDARRARRILLMNELTQQADFVEAVIASFISYMACAMFIHAAYMRYYWILFAMMASLPAAAENEIDRKDWE